MDMFLSSQGRRYGERDGGRKSCPPYPRPWTAFRLQTRSRVSGSHPARQSSGRPGRGRQAQGQAQEAFPCRGRSLGVVGKPAPTLEPEEGKPSSHHRGRGGRLCCPRPARPEKRLPRAWGHPGRGPRGRARQAGSFGLRAARRPEAERSATRTPVSPSCRARTRSIQRCPPAPDGPRAPSTLKQDGSPGLGVQGPHSGIFGRIFHALPPPPPAGPRTARLRGSRYPVVSAPSPQPLRT